MESILIQIEPGHQTNSNEEPPSPAIHPVAAYLFLQDAPGGLPVP